jgi:hypothetical protein
MVVKKFRVTLSYRAGGVGRVAFPYEVKAIVGPEPAITLRMPHLTLVVRAGDRLTESAVEALGAVAVLTVRPVK